MTTRSSTTQDNGKLSHAPSLWVASLVCSLATSFLLYSFVLKVSPSTMTHELMHEFRLNTTWLGIVISFCSYTYTLFQVPAGVSLDKFGPRKLLTLTTLICALGALLFGSASEWIVLSMGRLLIGAASAFSFTGALIIASNWFSPHYFPIVTGIVQISSSIGAIAGQKSLVPFVQKWGWRTTTNYLGYIGLGLSLLIWLIVRDTPHQSSLNPSVKKYSWEQEIKKLSLVLHNPETWRIGLYSFAVWAPIVAFVELWGMPFLQSAYHLEPQAASNALALTWLSIGIGSLFLGWWSNHIKQRNLPLTASAVIGIISWLALIFIKLPMYALYINLCIIGLAASGQALSFAVVKENNSLDVTGTAVGINNTAVVAGGAIFQPLLGFLLQWDQKTFLVLPICYLIAAIVSHFLLKETNCKTQYNLK